MYIYVALYSPGVNISCNKALSDSRVEEEDDEEEEEK